MIGNRRLINAPDDGDVEMRDERGDKSRVSQRSCQKGREEGVVANEREGEQSQVKSCV